MCTAQTRPRALQAVQLLFLRIALLCRTRLRQDFEAKLLQVMLLLDLPERFNPSVPLTLTLLFALVSHTVWTELWAYREIIAIITPAKLALLLWTDKALVARAQALGVGKLPDL